MTVSVARAVGRRTGRLPCWGDTGAADYSMLTASLAGERAQTRPAYQSSEIG